MSDPIKNTVIKHTFKSSAFLRFKHHETNEATAAHDSITWWNRNHGNQRTHDNWLKFRINESNSKPKLVVILYFNHKIWQTYVIIQKEKTYCVKWTIDPGTHSNWQTSSRISWYIDALKIASLDHNKERKYNIGQKYRTSYWPLKMI